MKKVLEKILLIMVTVTLVISIKQPVFGAYNSYVEMTSDSGAANDFETGYWGDVAYTFDKTTGVFTIRGTGKTGDIHNRPFSSDLLLIKELYIEKGVTGIGGSAFNGCSNLNTIQLPDGLTSIGAGAFYKCSSVERIDIPRSMTYIGSDAFNGCERLKRIDIPLGVTGLFDRTFKDCSSLESIVIPQTVTSIGNLTFSGCSSLTRIVIPESILSIGVEAFEGIDPSFTVYTFPDSFASTSFAPSHITFLYESPGGDSNTDYLGFVSDKIFIASDDAVSLSDYLITNLDIEKCTVNIQDEALYYYSDGMIASLGEGESILTVSSGDLTTTVDLISSKQVTPTTSIQFTDSSMMLETGNTALGRVDMWPENASERDLLWSSDDENVATVEKGLIKAVNPGKAIITASLKSNGRIRTQCEVTVGELLEAIVTFESALPYRIQNYDTKKINYYLYPADAIDAELQYTSSDESIISIDDDGMMTAHDNGTVIITISSGEITKNVEVTVYTPITGISFNPKSVRVNCGETVSLNTILEPENTTERELEWSSNSDSITVDENGNVTAHNTGIAVITATSKVRDVSATCNIISNEHSWDEGIVTKAPTCTEEGTIEYTCQGCGKTKTESVPCHTNSLNYINEKQPGCTEDGNTEYWECYECGKYFSDDKAQNQIEMTEWFIEKLGHDWNGGTTTKAATCTEAGLKTYICRRCNEQKTEEIKATGHTEVEDTATDPTCTETGKTAGSHCSVCGVVFTAQVEIPALGHDWNEGVVTRAATCTVAGERTYTCKQCRTKRTEEIKATGHTEVKDAAEEPTCTKEGKTAGSHCIVCKKVLTRQEIIPALGHDWDDGVVTREATCTKTGVKTYTCNRCGEKTDESIAKISHVAVTDAAIEPTCTEPGKTAGSHCSVCSMVITAQQNIPAKGHQYGPWESCGKEDHKHICQRCDLEEMETHNWGDPEVTREATYEEEGILTYTCTACDQTKTEAIPKPIAHVSSVTLESDEVQIKTDSTLQLEADIEPKYASNKNVSWNSSNPAVAKVDENGLVTALTYGKTIIMVTTEDGGKTASIEIQTRYYDVAGSPNKGDENYQYYFTPVYWAADHNITKGYGNVYFGPDENCTREQMITFLWRAAGGPVELGTMPFSDVKKGKYYYDAVLWAYKNGITKGYANGTFGVGETITREDTVTFIYRIAGKPKYSTTKTFIDVKKGKYYYDAIRWAAKNKITNGYADGSFGVGKDVLRKDIVTFLYRYSTAE